MTWTGKTNLSHPLILCVCVCVCVKCVPLMQLSPDVPQGLHSIAYTVQCSTILCLFSGFQLALRACMVYVADGVSWQLL